MAWRKREWKVGSKRVCWRRLILNSVDGAGACDDLGMHHVAVVKFLNFIEVVAIFNLFCMGRALYIPKL